MKSTNLLHNKENLNNSPVFYRGVIEDRKDPKKLGRCKVRILGIHPFNALRTGVNMGVPTDELPWAELMQSTAYTGGMSGIGVSAVPLQGSWVWVFLENGDFNRPVIVGLIYGISNEQRPGSPKVWGFHDPAKEFPIKDRLGEPDFNRLACNRKVIPETLIGTVKDAKRDLSIPTATGNTWDELKQKTTSADYPDNKVIEMKGGSFIEYDDTPGNQRFHWFHKTGTYWEVVEEGDDTTKVSRDKYSIINRDNMNLVKRDEFTTIRRHHELKVDKDQHILIGGDHEEIVKKDVTQVYKKNMYTKVSKHTQLETGTDYSLKAGTNIKVQAGTNMEVKAGTVMSFKAGSLMTHKAPMIKLN